MNCLTVSEMSCADQLTIRKGVSGAFLMSEAGRLVADAAEGLNYGPCKIVVLAGPGNNGGDAFVAARLLAERSYQVDLYLVGNADKLQGDAALMAGLYDAPIRPINQVSFDSADIIIDGIFGAGLARPIEGELADIIQRTNAADKPTIAIDIPSGINADTGRIMGCAIEATKTVTFFRPKPGHFLYPGRLLTGDLLIGDIGISNRCLSEISPDCSKNTPSLWQAHLMQPEETAHKYKKGCALVLEGSKTMRGAAVLAASAALRNGAGLVIHAATDQSDIIDPRLPAAVMSAQLEDLSELTDLITTRRVTTALIGPGWALGEATRQASLTLIKSNISLVLDAGALTSFADSPDLLIDKLKSRGEDQQVILTPHEGEFSRLFGDLIKTDGKLEAARVAAERTGSYIVLKGADTVIAAPDGKAAINTNAPPFLATAGSGDVLAGMITGLLANGVPAFEAAAASVYLHGECAHSAGENLIADDLVAEIAATKNRYASRI